MPLTRSSVAHSFFAPSDTDEVEDTSAMSTGRSRTVARSEEMARTVTELQRAERSCLALPGEDGDDGDEENEHDGDCIGGPDQRRSAASLRKPYWAG